jgi:hypothetical protein
VSTLTVADEIALKAPSWTYQGSRSILAMMNRAQNFLFSKLCLQSVYLDPLTGDNPFLSTTGTTRNYTLPNVTVSVDDVDRSLRIGMAHELYSTYDPANDYTLRPYNPNAWTRRGNRIYWRFSPQPATEINAASVSLLFDPGTYTDKYQYVALLEPLQLTSEAIPLMVGLNDEWAIIEGALGFIEYFDYGRSDRLDKFKEQIAREFWDKYRAVATPDKTFATPRRKF